VSPGREHRLNRLETPLICTSGAFSGRLLGEENGRDKAPLVEEPGNCIDHAIALLPEALKVAAARAASVLGSTRRSPPCRKANLPAVPRPRGGRLV
jgi:hypothetical protein